MKSILFKISIILILVVVYYCAYKSLDNLFNNNEDWKSYDISGVIDSVYRVKNNKNLPEFRIKTTTRYYNNLYYQFYDSKQIELGDSIIKPKNTEDIILIKKIVE